APISCRGACGRGDLAALLGFGLAHPRARQPRAAVDRGGKDRPVRYVWNRPDERGARPLGKNQGRGRGAAASLARTNIPESSVLSACDPRRALLPPSGFPSPPPPVVLLDPFEALADKRRGESDHGCPDSRRWGGDSRGIVCSPPCACGGACRRA